MSDADRVSIGYKVESVYGTMPTGTNYQEMRLRSESLAQQTSSIRSQELRSDRQIVGVKRSDIRVAGSIEGEFSWGTYDDFLEAALFSAVWTTAASFTGTVYTTTSGTVIHRSTGSFVTDAYAVGDWIKTSGFVNSANNDFFRVTAVAATDLTVTGATLTVEGGTPSVTIKKFASIVNGTTAKSFSLQRKYTDLSNEVSYFKGIMFESFTLRVETQQLLTISFECAGKQEVSGTTQETLTAATTTDQTNAIDDIQLISENGVVVADVLSMILTVKNNLRVRTAVGTLGALSIGAGKCDVTGTLRLYYSSKTIYDRYLNFSNTSLLFRIKDSSNNYYIIEMPRVFLTTGARVPPGENSDIVADYSFQAVRDPTQGITFRMARLSVLT